MNDQTALPVLGYTDQSEENLRLVNRNKVIEEQILRHIEAIERDIGRAGADDHEAYRWLYLSKQQIELGFMALNRAIFKPKRLEHID